MYDELVARLPHRAETIFHLPYGIPLPSAVRRAADGPLRAIYAGRFEQEQKGVFDLPEIDRALQAMGVNVEWTVAGAGPDEDAAETSLGVQPARRWTGPLTNAELLALYARQDVFVLPTRFEGFPVALVEAMAAGLPAVVSDIPSGVPEIVEAGVNGERPPIGDVGAFAASIAGSRSRPRASGGDERRRPPGRRDAGSISAIASPTTRRLYARWRELYRPLAPARISSTAAVSISRGCRIRSCGSSARRSESAR